ncbi:hypothetical protein M5689_003618 [Euphorbia peplus]|nr:hypothetical protein M5689_003618 [Euphorbia peplus]
MLLFSSFKTMCWSIRSCCCAACCSYAFYMDFIILNTSPAVGSSSSSSSSPKAASRFLVVSLFWIVDWGGSSISSRSGEELSSRCGLEFATSMFIGNLLRGVLFVISDIW